MIVEIPIAVTTLDMRQTTSLDGSPYVLDLSWSDRSQSWYLSLFQQRETDVITPVLQGVRISIGYPLLVPAAAVDGRPPGELIAIDTSDTGTDPGFADLGARVRLYYYDADEMVRIRG